MVSPSHVIALVLAACGFVAGLPSSRRDGACVDRLQRKGWQDLTEAERASYINATLCLTTSPAKHSIPGAKTLWDELQYVHIKQADYIHFTGSFLPWHRYFLSAHDKLLKEECGYKGPMPYWNETLDVGKVKKSMIFDAKTGFGGDGANPTRCIQDGPFASLRLRFDEDLNTTSYCVTRNINECSFFGASQTSLDSCRSKTNYRDFWNCIEGQPHSAGHGGIGGIMINTQLSPGDPIFWLHHTWLDHLWWQWQSLNPSVRLAEVTGVNVPDWRLRPLFGGPNATMTPPNSTAMPPMPPMPPMDPSCLALFGGTSGASPVNPLAGSSPGGGFRFPSDASKKPNTALTHYFNDGGNITTLNHTLWSAGILPNATIRDVMDLHGPLVCAEYM